MDGLKTISKANAHPAHFSISPFHRSSAPRLLSLHTLCSGSAEHSDSSGLRALSPGCCGKHRVNYFFFFCYSCIPGNAEGLRNHISNAPAAAAVTLLHVKEQACPQHSHSGLQSVPVGPQTREGIGESREGENGREQIRLEDGGLILTGTGKSGR